MEEEILLKQLLSVNEVFSKVIPIIEPKYFTQQGCARIIKLAKDYYIKYSTIPTLQEIIVMIREVPNAELRKAIATDLKVINSHEIIANTEFVLEKFVNFIKNSIFTEALIIGSDAIQEKNEEKILKSKELMEEMSKISINSDLGLDFDNIQEMIDYYENKLYGIKTQHNELNKRLGPGFLPGTLSIIMAASGIGKSLLMTDVISGNIKDNKNVLLISMEMQDKEIMKRVHANALDLPINHLTDLSLTEGQREQLKEKDNTREILSKDEILQKYNKLKMSGRCGRLYIKDYPNGSFSPLMLESLLDNYKLEQNIEFDLVYLDYLGIMKSDLITPNAGLYSYIKSIVEETRAIAKKREIPIISASQLNRSATGSNLNIADVDNDSVSDSIGTVQTADFILFLLQTPVMKEEGLLTCKVTKNRFNGRTDYWDMNIDYKHMRFSDAINSSGMQNKEINKTLAEIKAYDMKIIKAKDNEIKDDFGSSEISETSEIKPELDVLAELGLT